MNSNTDRNGGCTSLQAGDETEIQFSDCCLQYVVIREPLVLFINI